MDAAAARLFAVLTHHTQLGFAGALLYDHGSYADALRHHPLLAAFVARGRLVIVPWGAQGGGLVPAIASEVRAAVRMRLTPYQAAQVDQWPEWPTFDQPQVYTHAALSAWGSNAMLLFTDVDEFLVLPSLADPYPGASLPPCLIDLAYAHLHRINFLCPASLHELQHTPATPAAILAHHAACTLTKSSEAWTDWPKVMAHADALAAMGIHDGVVWEGYAARVAAPLPRACAWLVHLHNVAFTRHEVGEDGEFAHDPAWTAPLQNALAVHAPGS